MSYDKQCSSCGGFCGRGGCKRENVDSWEQRQRMATPHDQLIAELLDSRIPKTEREHAAAREIKRLREALAEPEQKPTGIIRTIGGYPDESQHTVEWLVKHKDLHDGDKLYTLPPARKPLTDEDVMSLALKYDLDATWSKHLFKFVRAIERAHGIGE